MDHLGKLVLRLSIGGLMLFHGIHKLIYGFDMIGDLLVKNHLPREMMWGVLAGEVIAPVLMIIGWMTRSAAALVAFTMAMAMYLVFRENLFVLDSNGALPYELTLIYLLGAIAIMFLGAGRISISGIQKKVD